MERKNDKNDVLGAKNHCGFNVHFGNFSYSEWVKTINGSTRSPVYR